MDSSGRHVLVKAVPESSKEWRIISALMSLNYDPENHTIPIVDVLHRDGTVFIVQAQWHDYPFSRPLNFHQWIVVAYQVLEGLAFMHRQGIGHGEILCATTMARLHIQSLKTAAFESHSSASGPQSNVEEKLVPSLIRNSSPHPFRTDSLSRRSQLGTALRRAC
ncbi:hypothetical protein B0H11DRAFT_1962228 [Mycena galericulata]|nr:hypothetical protein B0H11DRAFT_1962228 [Mycena galericulata]